MGSTISTICCKENSSTNTSTADSSSLSSSNTTDNNDGFKTPTNSYIPKQRGSPPLIKRRYNVRKRADSM